MAVQMSAVMGSALRETRIHPVDLRLRAQVGGQTVVDSTAARIVWEPRRVVGSYAVPVTDVTGRLAPADVDRVSEADLVDLRPVLTPRHAFAVHSETGRVCDIHTDEATLPAAAFLPDDPDLDGYAILDWDAFTTWREEEDVVVGHPRDPFHRIQCLDSSRHVVVEIAGTVVAETHTPVLLLETNLPPRWYLPRTDVRMDLLTPSESLTTCAYKGHASYYSVAIGDTTLDDIVWTYEDPQHDAEQVRDALCFYVEHTDTLVDGERLGRPQTEWSRQRT